MLATGDSNTKVRIYDIASGRLLGIGASAATKAFTVAFSPDGMSLAAGEAGADHAVRLWNVSSLRSSWQPLFDGKSLDGWQVIAESPDLVTAATVDGEPAIRITGAEKDAYVSSKWRCRDYEARLEFRLDPADSKSSGYLGIAFLGGQVGLPFRFSSKATDKVVSDRWRLELELAEPSKNRIVPTGSKPLRILPFPNAVLKPVGEWNRFEILRLDDAVAIRLNCRYLDAFGHLRPKLDDGSEPDFGRSFFNLTRTEGTVFFRKIEVRELHELPPGFASAP